jgi:hypothetical protein
MAATTVDTLLVRVEADLRDVRRELKNLETTTSRSAQRMSKAMSGFGKIIGPVLGTITVLAAGKATLSIIKFGSSIEEMQAKSSVVFGQFAGEVRSQLAEFGEEVGRSRFELEGMAASIQDTFVPMGFARGEAAQLSVQLTKLATDVASFNNASDTETMAAFQSALVGNHETVRRFGVVITEATIKQELLRMGITKSAKEITNAEKVQARLNLLLAGTTDAQGDAARTAGSFANQTRALQAALGNLGAEIAQELLPPATAIVSAFREATVAFKEFLAESGLIDLSLTEALAKNTRDILEAEIELARHKKATGTTRSNDDDKRLRALKEEKKRLEGINAEIQKMMSMSKMIGIRSRLPTVDMVGPTARPEDIPTRPADELLKDLKNETALLDAQVKARGTLSESTLRFLKIKQDVANVNEQDAENIKKELIAQSRLTQTLTLREMQQQDLLKHFEKEAEKRKEINDSIDDMTSANKRLKLEVDGATEAELRFFDIQQKLGPLTKNQTDRIKEQIDANIELANTLDPVLTPMMEAQQRAIEGLSDSLSSNLADMAMSGKLNLESLQSSFKSFTKAIIQEGIKLAVINPLLNRIFNPTNALTVAGGDGLMGSIAGAIGGKAGGGSISAPTIVGERGPELFVPHSAGVIKNAHATRGMMGGSPVVVNQNLNIETGVAQTVRAEILTMMPMIQNSTVSAVQNARQRGGSFAASFGG